MTIDGGYMPSVKAFLDADNAFTESLGCFFVCFGMNMNGGRVAVPNCSSTIKWDTLDATVEPNLGTM
jgi:hypothetical protein